MIRNSANSFVGAVARVASLTPRPTLASFCSFWVLLLVIAPTSRAPALAQAISEHVRPQAVQANAEAQSYGQRSESIAALPVSEPRTSAPTSRLREASPAPDSQGRRYLDPVFDAVDREDDIVFGKAVDKPSGREVELKLDVYEPAGDTEESRPVFVFFFGGGFVAGDRKREPQFYCNLMARRGYVALAPDYRINQGNIVTEGIPAAVSDARQVLSWIEAEAEARGLDKERVVFGGSSAGAITALFASYTELEADPDAMAAEPALVLDLWGGLYTYVSEMEPGEPPLAIFHGTEDRVVPYAEAEALRDRAEEVDIRYLFTPLVGEAHAPFMPDSILSLFSGFAYDVLELDAAPTAEPSPLPSLTPEAPTATAPPAPSATPVPTEVEERWWAHLPLLWTGDR